MLCERGVLEKFSKFKEKFKKQSPGGVLPKDVLKGFAKFTEKNLCQNLFFNKAAGWKHETATDRRGHCRCSVK